MLKQIKNKILKLKTHNQTSKQSYRYYLINHQTEKQRERDRKVQTRKLLIQLKDNVANFFTCTNNINIIY